MGEVMVSSDVDSKSSLSKSSTISTAAINNIIDKLKNDQHRDSTKATYYGIWKQFCKFYLRLDEKPVLWEDKITLFMVYLINNNCKTSTVKSYVSVLRAILKIDNIKLSPDSVLLTALTRACRKWNDKIRIILPIRKSVLLVLLITLDKVFDDNPQPYLVSLYKAMFSTAYFGLFRIGEITQSPHVVKAKDVHIATNKNKIMMLLHSSKTHDKSSKPHIIKLVGQIIAESAVPGSSQNTQSISSAVCPFRLLKDYLSHCKGYKSDTEQFFVFRDCLPVQPQQFRHMLQKLLKLARFESHRYNSSSFRAGRATDMMEAGVPIDTIQKLGRWKSTAMYTYLRT